MTPQLVTLGTGAAASDPHRTTVMIAATNGRSSILVDCGGDAIQRYLEAGLDLDTLDALIITHEHADHVSGFPLLVEKLWLHQRSAPLPIYGIEPALSQARRCFDTFDTSGWEGMPELQWNEFEYEQDAQVLQSDDWSITAAPTDHSKPCVGLRFEASGSDRVATYSCDTAPTESIARLAQDTDLLIHEANGAMEGHSSPEGAAKIAHQAGAQHLVLVHLPPGMTEADLTAARKHFESIELAKELEFYPF